MRIVVGFHSELVDFAQDHIMRLPPRDTAAVKTQNIDLRFILFFIQRELSAGSSGHIDFPLIWTDLLKLIRWCSEFIRATPWPLDNDLNRGCTSNRSHEVVTYYSDNLARSDYGRCRYRHQRGHQLSFQIVLHSQSKMTQGISLFLQPRRITLPMPFLTARAASGRAIAMRDTTTRKPPATWLP